jgi:hypothetical protein
MPKITKSENRGFFSFDFELRKGAQQRAPTHSEPFWDSDERG